jgi:hypothetical protein
MRAEGRGGRRRRTGEKTKTDYREPVSTVGLVCSIRSDQKDYRQARNETIQALSRIGQEPYDAFTVCPAERP